MDLTALFLNYVPAGQRTEPTPEDSTEPADSSEFAEIKTGPVQRQVRLLEHQVLDLVTQYVAGATVPELVSEFEINRTTVLEHLKRQGVPRRSQQRKLTDAMVTEAVDLYVNHHWSYLRLGDRYNVDDETVRKELKRAGVVSRPRRGSQP